MTGIKCGGWRHKVGQIVVHALKPGGKFTLCGLKVGARWAWVAKPKWGAKCRVCREAAR
jgi:hypothetical protein